MNLSMYCICDIIILDFQLHFEENLSALKLNYIKTDRYSIFCTVLNYIEYNCRDLCVLVIGNLPKMYYHCNPPLLNCI